MIKLIKPSLEHREKYEDMIREWQKFGDPYVPCIIEYSCNKASKKSNYETILKIVEDYSKGKLFAF